GFRSGVGALSSPDLKWIAIREYQRSFITPFSDAGRPVTVSPFEGIGFSVRADPEGGGYLTWSADGATLGWTRASGFYEKDVTQILAEAGTRPAAGSDW